MQNSDVKDNIQQHVVEGMHIYTQPTCICMHTHMQEQIHGMEHSIIYESTMQYAIKRTTFISYLLDSIINIHHHRNS